MNWVSGGVHFLFLFFWNDTDHSEVLFILFAILKEEEKKNVKYTFWYEGKQLDQENCHLN
jgi:hypothetical protein